MGFFVDTPPEEPTTEEMQAIVEDIDAEVKQIRILDIWEMFNKKPPPPLVHELLDKDALTFFVGT